MDFCKFTMQKLFTPKNTLAENKIPMQSRRNSAASATSSGRYYANRTKSLKSLEQPRNFGKRLLGKKISMDKKEMRRFSSAQASQAAQVLSSGSNN